MVSSGQVKDGVVNVGFTESCSEYSKLSLGLMDKMDGLDISQAATVLPMEH